MTETQNSKQYDLEERTYKLAKECRDFVKKLPRNQSNLEYSKQLIRSSGPIAANYIEANESLSKKDFVMRVKISRKEAKETVLWLKLTEPKQENDKEKERLIAEGKELMKIFGSIIEKCK
ncbi:MAG: four helix bundle protein [Candidatus Moranbacteria bacterium]|nr:four helix bundle protein [Candidatus Moranbacteria bacterium]